MPHTDGTPDRIVHGDTDSNGSASESLASEHDEDSPHQSGDKGIQVLGVRADAAGSLVDTDGDYAPFQVDATGALRVTTAGAGPAASVAIVDTGGDELDVQPDGSIDVNIVSSTGGGLTDAELRATPVPVVTQEPISVDDNGGSLTVDGTVAVTGTQTDALTDAELRATPVPVVTQEPISVDDNGGSLTVDGSVAVSNFPATQPVSGTVTADTELPAAAALADNTANPTVPGVGAFGMVYDGSTWDRLPGTSAGGVLATIGTLPSGSTGVWADGQGAQIPFTPGGASSWGWLATIAYMFNGSTYDRARGDAANGLDVDVTRLPALPAGTNNIGDVDVETYELSPETVLQNAATANGNGTSMAVSGYSVAALEATGTYNASVNLEGSRDGGTTWSALVAAALPTMFTTTTLSGGGILYRVSVSGLTHIRTRISGYVSGTITVKGTASASPDTPVMAVKLGPGSESIGNVTLNSGANIIGSVELVAGTANIGDVGVASIAAGTNTIGATTGVSGELADNDGDICTVKVAFAQVTGATAHTEIVAAVASKKIRVLSLWITTYTAIAGGTGTFAETGSATDIATGPKWSLVAVTGDAGRQIMSPPGGFLCETAAGNSLRVKHSANTGNSHYHINYIEV